MSLCEIQINVRMRSICFIHHVVSTQERLQEAALAAANVSKDITAEDAALRLLLLQVNLLISGHCAGEGGASKDQFRLLLYVNYICEITINPNTDLQPLY